MRKGDGETMTVQNSKGKCHLRDLGKDGRIILRWVLDSVVWVCELDSSRSGQGPLNTVFNISVPLSLGNFLTSCITVSFSRTLQVGQYNGDALDLYMGGDWFENRPDVQRSWFRFSLFSSVCRGKCWEKYLHSSKFFRTHHLPIILWFSAPVQIYRR